MLPLAHHREPSAMKCWILEILCCDPEGSRAFLRILSTKGRGASLCWAKSKPTGPKGPEKAQDLKDLKRLAWDHGVHVSMATIGVPSHASHEDSPLAARREPSALESWSLEILRCDPKGSRAFRCSPMLGACQT